MILTTPDQQHYKVSARSQMATTRALKADASNNCLLWTGLAKRLAEIDYEHQNQKLILDYITSTTKKVLVRKALNRV